MTEKFILKSETSEENVIECDTLHVKRFIQVGDDSAIGRIILGADENSVVISAGQSTSDNNTFDNCIAIIFDKDKARIIIQNPKTDNGELTKNTIQIHTDSEGTEIVLRHVDESEENGSRLSLLLDDDNPVIFLHDSKSAKIIEIDDEIKGPTTQNE